MIRVIHTALDNYETDETPKDNVKLKIDVPERYHSTEFSIVNLVLM